MTASHPLPSRIVGVEEHVAFPDLLARLPNDRVQQRGYVSNEQPFGRASLLDKLSDTDARLADLDAAGVTVQILSYPIVGGDLLPPAEAVVWTREINDRIAERVREHPDRYAGLAHLPLASPQAAPEEFERAVTELGFKGALVSGATEGRYLDHPDFDGVLAQAEKLDLPIYLHPAPSPKPVRDALYGGLPGDLGFWMSVSGWGWHVDTAVHVLRLMLSGAFERHPGLKIVIGHLGEGLQVMTSRFDQQFHTFAGFKDLPSEILRKHVWVSTGGFFTKPSFAAALDAFGPDRLLYAVDYPWGSLEGGQAFMESLTVEAGVLDKIAHRNADQLFKLKT